MNLLLDGVLLVEHVPHGDNGYQTFGIHHRKKSMLTSQKKSLCEHKFTELCHEDINLRNTIKNVSDNKVVVFSSQNDFMQNT